MSASVDTAISKIRDLVNDHPVRAYFVNSDEWIKLTDSMDAVQDNDGHQQLDGLTAMSEVAGLPPLAAGDSVEQQLELIRTRFEEVRQQLYSVHTERPLYPVFDDQTGYALEKIGGASSGGQSDGAMARGGIAVLRSQLKEFEAGLKLRGLQPDDFCADASYVLNRTNHYLDGVEGAPNAADLHIMTRWLNNQIRELIELAATIDREDKEQAG